MATAAKYAKDVHDSDRLNSEKVRAEASRKCVKQIQHVPVLSGEWISLADSLEQLTRLAQMEGMMPPNTKVSESQGRDKDSDGTLWDQEQHENAIRVLVEEAKVNLCIRMMNEFKRWQYNAAEKRAKIKEASRQYGTEVQLERKCLVFEECLGNLVARSFAHVETLQLTDNTMLLEHCCFVLEGCKAAGIPVGANIKTQETVVLSYFAAVARFAEELNNSELLSKMRDFGLVHLVANHWLSHMDAYPPEVGKTVAEGLAYLADNEDFRTEWPMFFADASHKKTFLELEEKLTEPLLKRSPEMRKQLRPLTDLFAGIKRSMK